MPRTSWGLARWGRWPFFGLTLLAGGLATAMLAQDSAAQDRGEREGKRDRGEFKGDFKGGRGGPGGWGGAGGGWGGGGDSLGGLDANGNGMIDPGEIQGPAQFFIPRLASEAGLDPSQPMPLDQLRAAREKMRSSGGFPGGPGGGGPGGGFPGGPMGGDRERSRDERREERREEKDRDSRPSQDPKSAEKPLVPGFGEDLKIAAVPGFGEALTGASAIHIPGHDPKAEEYVNDLLKRYDKNKNGILEQEEWKEGRWSPDATESDTNRDTKLSREELLARYVRRTAARSPSSGSGGGSSSGSASGGGSSTSSGSGEANADPDGKLLRFAESMMARYDENKDGILQKEEWQNMRGDPAAADKNKDGLITKEELAERLAGFGGGGGGWGGPPGGGPGGGGPGGGGPGGGGFGGREGRDRDREGGGGSGWGGGASTASSKGSTKTTGGKVYKFTSPTARLPKNVPTWFTRNDANADGQIVMSEFSTTWTDAKVAEFAKYDLNGDGLITPDEVVEADKKK